MENSVVLVLGAGASKIMGYPLGEELSQIIISNAAGSLSGLISSSYSRIALDEIESFVEVFALSQAPSIDAFLARRPEFAKVGKLAIAAVLLGKENINYFKNAATNDHWYKYFVHKKVSNHSWEELDLSPISIVSFNYDRSFEYYLIQVISHTYDKTFVQAYEKVNQMKIIHIYGTLGSCKPSDSSFTVYGEEPTPSLVMAAAERLRVIPEGRDDDAVLTAARTVLSQAKRIAFLGFGFDETNLKRLRSTETCVSEILLSHDDGRSSKYTRRIAATCYGMTQAEMKVAAVNTAGPNYLLVGELYRSCQCSELLRETLILT